MVLVWLPPCARETAAGEEDSVKPGGELTVSATDVEAVSVPETPFTVTVTGPSAVAPLPAVSVSTLYVAAGLGVKDAVTPLGRPEADKVTWPANWFAPFTMMVLLTEPPRLAVTLPGEDESVKLGGAVTVRATVVVAVSAPEVPVMVTIAGSPRAAVLLAVSVITVEFNVGLGAKDAVTPLGSPEAVNVTLPLKPPAPVIVMLLDPLVPCARVMPVGHGNRVKLGL